MKIIFYYIDRVAAHPIFRQLSWYTVGQIAIQAFSFLGVIVTSRYLGPTNVGLYSFVQNYLATFMTLTIGMDFYFTWKVAKSEQKEEDLADYFGHKLNVTTFLTIAGVVAAWTILPGDVALLATIMFVPLVLSTCSAFLQYAIATNNARIIATLQVIAAFILFSAKMTLVAYEAALPAFVVVNAIDTILVSSMLALVFISRKSIRAAFSRTIFPSLWRTAQFMYAIKASLLAIALWQLILRIDQLVLATFSNAYDLGIYAAAVKIAEVPNFLAGVLYTALVSHVALFAGLDDDHSKRRMRQVLFAYGAIGSIIGLFIVAVAPYAISFLYGAKFLEAIPILRAYALSIPGMFVTLYYFGIYGARDRHLFQSAVFALALILNVALIYILTPVFGLTGAALATAAAYTTVAATFYFHMR
jgi:O-antigen/teichoic acid export membrane protein